MNGFKLRADGSGRDRWVGRVLATGFFVLAFALPAWANPIKARKHTSASDPILKEWASFLAGGQAEWASVHAPPITAAVKREANQALASSDPTSTSFVQYLEWRHNLDPARFDYWHPTLGPVLEKLQIPKTPARVPPINPAPQLIPEPSTLALSLTLLGAVAWWRGRTTRGGSKSVL